MSGSPDYQRRHLSELQRPEARRPRATIDLEIRVHKCSAMLILLCAAGITPSLEIPQGERSVGESRHPATLPARDGEHDFDFEFGTWKTHLRRLQHPLSGDTTWLTYDGTSIVRKIWNGKANIVELIADGPAGHLEALSLRLYNPESHQWSINSASSRTGTISVPTIGEFRNGRGEFHDQETFNGRAILVRNVWSDITSTSCRFAQSFSDDGGRTWEVNWVAVDSLVTR